MLNSITKCTRPRQTLFLVKEKQAQQRLGRKRDFLEKKIEPPDFKWFSFFFMQINGNYIHTYIQSDK